MYNDINNLIATKTRTKERSTSRASTSSVSTVCSLDRFIDSEGDSDDEVREDTLYCIELTTYLNQLAPKGDFDLRKYWFNNRHVFPNLFKLFLRISCIPASSAPAERVFSTCGAVVTDRRSSLLPKSVGEIIVCRNLYKH